MKGQVQHSLYLCTQFIQNKVLVDQLNLEKDVNAFDDQDSQYPQVVLGYVKDIQTKDIAWVHQIKKVGASCVVSVNLVQHVQQCWRLLPNHLEKFGGNKKNKEYKFIRHVK